MKDARLLRRLVVTLIVLGVALVLSLRAIGPGASGKEVSLDEALRLAQGGDVSAAVFRDYDSRAILETGAGRDGGGRGGRKVWTAYGTSPGSNAALLEATVEGGARVSVDQQWNKRLLGILAQFILPLLLLANLFGIFILLARGGPSQVRELFAFSRIRPRQATGAASEVTFADVAAADEVVTELAEVRDYLENPKRFEAMGALAPRGVLLSGPPGCGKTLLARALAGEAGVPFFHLSGSEFVESLVGVGAARVRDLFRQAKARAPAIVFVDELDAAGRRRGAGVGSGHDEREQTLNELLVQMDGFSPNSGVVVIAATNRPDILDPALLRPGRFDRHVVIDAPDVAGREEILRVHARSRRLARATDLAALARLTPGFTGADLANVINEAALLAVRARASSVGTEHLIEAVERAMAGPRRRGRLLGDDELQRLALHEAGHVVVAQDLEYPADIQRVSIVARGRGGTHAVLRRHDRSVFSRSELLAELAVTLAGRIAEELVTGEPSTAGEADIERATDLAREIAGRYGMSEAVGPMRVVQKDAEVFLGRDYLTARNVSPDTAAHLDTAVRGLLNDAAEQARAILTRRSTVLNRVAEALKERESLTHDEVSDLLVGTIGKKGTARRTTSRRTTSTR